ncbi:MAG: ATP phosphoribosyltransferase regulatory subunit, partial [Candidatus Baltobacteraceae bacterium]
DLVLRTEMTTPIARTVSSRLPETRLPLRLSYLSSVFRYEPRLARLRELTQAGAELIGCDGVGADAEALFMAIETLDAAGLSDACFDINDVRITDGILASIFSDPEPIAQCKRFIAERNLVELAAFGNMQGVNREDFDSFLDLVTKRGQQDALHIAQRLCNTVSSRSAIENLNEILKRAHSLGHQNRIFVDFSLLRRLQYYTGLVFEGYVKDLGFALCGGGRYDSLLPQFGMQTPAVGWMVEIEGILLALERRHTGTKRIKRIDVLVSGSDALAARERAKGNNVRADVTGLDRDALLRYAHEKSIARVLIERDGTVEEIRPDAEVPA